MRQDRATSKAGLTLVALLALTGAAMGQTNTDATGEVRLSLTAGGYLLSVTPVDPEQYADPVPLTVDPANPPAAPIVIQLKWRSYSFSGTAKSQAGVAAGRIDIFDELGAKLGTCPVNQTTGAFSFVSRAATYVLKPVWADATIQDEAQTVAADHTTGNPKPLTFLGVATAATVTVRIIGPDGQPVEGVGIIMERVE